LSIARGLHYSNLADATWSADGLNLVVCSTDGYLSILSFAPGELGDVYTPPVEDVAAEDSTLVPNTNITATTAPKHETTATTSTTVTPTAVPSPRSTQHLPLPNPNQVLLPPCEPGQTATIEAPPAKRAKKLRITPTLVSAGVGMTTTILPSKRPAAAYDEAEHVGEAVDKLSLHSSGAATTLEDPKPKKKKRIQPMLMSSSVTQQ
jgi:chromatin assembly factor 1 subunit B